MLHKNKACSIVTQLSGFLYLNSILLVSVAMAIMPSAGFLTTTKGNESDSEPPIDQYHYKFYDESKIKKVV